MPWKQRDTLSSRVDYESAQRDTVWRQRLAPCFVPSALRFGTSGLRFGASVNRGTVPLLRAPLHNPRPESCWSHFWCVSVTCSSRHLTSHLFHSYISTAHSLRPQGLCFLCVLGRFSSRIHEKIKLVL